MPARDRNRRLATQRAWYHRTKNTPHQQEKRRQSRQRRSHGKRAWFEEFRKKLRCLDCGETDPDCLQFHHRDREGKKFAIADAMRGAFTLPSIQREIPKCTVLCANCHAVRHHAERKTRCSEGPLRKRSVSLVEAFLRGDFDAVDD